MTLPPWPKGRPSPTYQIKTDGVTLTNISAIDDLLGSVNNISTTLNMGEITTGTLTYTVVESDLPGPIANTVIVTGTDELTNVVTGTTNISVDLANITFTKIATPTIAGVGDTITYTYQIENTGSATLFNVNASDDRLGTITDINTTLFSGEATIGTLTYTVAVTDLPGPLHNTAMVTGTTAGGDVTDTTTASVILLVPKPGLRS